MIQAHQGGKYHNIIGKFFPMNPEKYTATNKNIVFKSKLEQRFMIYLDKNPNVINWRYEPFPINYFDKSTNKKRKYYVDFIILVKGSVKNQVIYCEIKSKKETLPPKSKTNIKDNLLYLKNISKWEQATRYCDSIGAKFKIITEEQLK